MIIIFLFYQIIYCLRHHTYETLKNQFNFSSCFLFIWLRDIRRHWDRIIVNETYFNLIRTIVHYVCAQRAQ